VPKAKAKTSESNIQAVVGSDEAEVKRVAAELAAKLTPPEAGEFGLEVIDACADNVDQAVAKIRLAVEALQTLPFFGGSKLAELIDAGLPQDVTLLISATETDKRRSFYKTLGKRGEVQVIDRLDSSRSGWEEEATEVVRRKAKARKLQFDEEALDLFVLLTGGDTRQIENELEKIDLFLGKERRVSLEQVRELVPLSRTGVIFELGNALAACDLGRALMLVKRLLDQGESAIGILLVAILPTIRNLLLAKDLMERYRIPRPHAPFTFISALNRLPADATEHLPRKKDGSINGYALGIAAQQAHRFQTEKLIAGLEACLEANLRLVSSQLDHELILTEIVVKLLAC
jgi:DNA polymerase III subunit delta